MNRYTKSLEKGTFEYRFYEAMGFPPVSDIDENPFVLRITLGDMSLLDAFYMSLPVDDDSISIEGLIYKHVVCEDQEVRIGIKRKLFEYPNPDLIYIYDSLVEIYQQAESGQLAITYHVNNGGSYVQPDDPVSLHQQFRTTEDGKITYRLLDLVLEIEDRVDPFSNLEGKQKDEMLKDFRATFILYLIDKFDYRPDLESISFEFRDYLSDILAYLSSDTLGLISFDSDDKPFITYKGYDFLTDIVEEAEFYIDSYDIFGDVYTIGLKEICFNTGYGENLIIPALIREGIDPYRAIFISALYLGNMDEFLSDLNGIFSDNPFRELFRVVVTSPVPEEVGLARLDRIINEGKRMIEEQRLRQERSIYAEDIRRRAESL